jgi:S1-C subfamily serine protease
MYGGKQTLYDVLELRRSAKDDEILRAYQRLKAEMAKGISTPDPQRVALLHEAYEVLSDAQQRAEYDRSLRDLSFFGIARDARPSHKWAVLAAAVVLGAAGLYFVLERSGPKQTKAQEILAAASFSVGRLQALDVSGRATTVGLAGATSEGVMVTTCHGIPRGAQLVVRLEERTAGARVSLADAELDMCKLAGDGVGSQPLRVSDVMPKAGDKVYAPKVDASGKLSLEEGTVKQLLASPRGSVIEITIPIAPEASGGPLLDADGRMVGITTAPHNYGEGKNVAVPTAWINAARARAIAPRR